MTKEYYHIGLSQNGIDTVHNIEIVIPHDFKLIKIVMPTTIPRFSIRLFNKNVELYYESSLMIRDGNSHFIIYKPIQLKKDTVITANITNLLKEKQDFRATLFGTVKRND